MRREAGEGSLSSFHSLPLTNTGKGAAVTRESEVVQELRGIVDRVEERPKLALDMYLCALQLAALTESPIERLMALALSVLPSLADIPSAKVTITAQKNIGSRRVDFCVEQEGYARIVVECDGHDFHEKTKEQASADKRRDRELTLAGYTVLRFTGSEIYRDPFACSFDVYEILQRARAETRRVKDQAYRDHLRSLTREQLEAEFDRQHAGSAIYDDPETLAYVRHYWFSGQVFDPPPPPAIATPV